MKRIILYLLLFFSISLNAQIKEHKNICPPLIISNYNNNLPDILVLNHYSINNSKIIKKNTYTLIKDVDLRLKTPLKMIFTVNFILKRHSLFIVFF